MKNLKDTILEKLKIDDINLNDKFPIDGTIDDMIKFLEEKGFNDVYHNGGGVVDMFNKYNSKCFYKKEGIFWFGDTSKEKISKDNPIFYISISPKIFDVYFRDNNKWIIDIVENNKKAFMEELNKRFGWK